MIRSFILTSLPYKAIIMNGHLCIDKNHLNAPIRNLYRVLSMDCSMIYEIFILVIKLYNT